MIKVGVIFGGVSVEHEVSIISAVQAMNFLDTTKYEIIPIYIAKNRLWYTADALKDMKTYKDLSKIPSIAQEVILTKKDNEFVLKKNNSLLKNIVSYIDVVLPIVHGKGIEDGSLAGFLETIGIPYAAPSMLGAALGQDKVVQKQVLTASNVPVVPYIWFYDTEYLDNEKKILKDIKNLGYPVIIKPARLGSSVGINVCKNESEVCAAIDEAISYDNKIIVEKLITDLLEVDCAVVGNYQEMECSLIGEMMTENDFLTFEDKYLSDKAKKGSKTSLKNSNTGFRIPASIDKKIEEDIYNYAKQSFRALNLRGVTRFDFLIDTKSKMVYVNEPNTIPGCLAFFFFSKKNITYTKLLDRMIATAIKEYKDDLRKTISFESNILSTYDGSKGFKK